MANWILFQWGPMQFEVYPLGISDYAHHTGADWAKKEIAGAAMYREWVGEQDEMITVKGRVFPHFFSRHQKSRGIKDRVNNDDRADVDPATGLLLQRAGNVTSAGGLYHLDVMDNMRRQGQSHILIRGDGWHFGWFIIESLNRGHSLLAKDGIGQMIEFQAVFQRVPIPNDGASNIMQMYDSSGGPFA